MCFSFFFVIFFFSVIGGGLGSGAKADWNGIEANLKDVIQSMVFKLILWKKFSSYAKFNF